MICSHHRFLQYFNLAMTEKADQKNKAIGDNFELSCMKRHDNFEYILSRKQTKIIVTIFIVSVFFHYPGCFFHYPGCFFIIVGVSLLSWVLFPYSICPVISNMCIYHLGIYS